MYLEFEYILIRIRIRMGLFALNVCTYKEFTLVNFGKVNLIYFYACIIVLHFYIGTQK